MDMDYRDIIKQELKKVSESKFANKTDNQLAQFDEFVRKGAQASIKSDKFLEVRSKGGKVAGRRNVESGHLASIQSKAGKAGAKTQMEKGLGIHVDKETRREWSRLGGLKTIGQLNRERTCPYCGIVTKGAAYNRWHGDKCKHRPI
jgi:hypothetical protein